MNTFAARLGRLQGPRPAADPGAAKPNPRDSWAAWTDEPIPYRLGPVVPEVEEGPPCPERRAFLAGFFGIAATAVAGGGSAVASAMASPVDAPGPLATAHRRWLDAIRATDAIEAENRTLQRDDHAGHQDQERRLASASDLDGRCRAELVRLIADAAGFRFDRPDWVEVEAEGVACSVREGDRLFLLAVDHQDAFGHRRGERFPGPDGFRPLVADLSGSGPLPPARTADRRGDVPLPPVTLRSMHDIGGHVVIVEAGVFTAAALEETDIPDDAGWHVSWVDGYAFARRVSAIDHMTALERLNVARHESVKLGGQTS